MTQPSLTRDRIEQIVGDYLKNRPGARLWMVQREVASRDPEAYPGNKNRARTIRRAKMVRETLEKHHQNRATEHKHAWFY